MTPAETLQSIDYELACFADQKALLARLGVCGVGLAAEAAAALPETPVAVATSALHSDVFGFNPGSWIQRVKAGM
jgi:hypothetical protein